MKGLGSNLKHTGYDQEEAYFHKKNQELTANYKKSLEQPGELPSNVIQLPVSRNRPPPIKKHRQDKKAA